MTKKDRRKTPSQNPHKGAGGKTPKAAHNVDTVKRPAISTELQERVSQRTLQFSFRHVDHGGPWGFESMSPGDVVELFEGLGKFESMTVGELAASDNHHFVEYGDMSQCPNPEPVRRLAEHYQGADTVCRLRLSGKKRLYGIRQKHVFAILWWDPEHEIWPSQR